MINAGTGNNTIKLGSYSTNPADYNQIIYASGDGNDVIIGYNDTNTIKITDSSYSTQRSGSDIIINVGNGSITLKKS